MSGDDKTYALYDKPFTFEEHGFVFGVGFYILKSAIHRRIREIDPHYRSTSPELMMIDADTVMMRGGLTILGDTRYAVGTGKIDQVKWDKDKKQEVPLTASELLRNKHKAIKTAGSDLLPRGAQQFGIGDYMRDIPKESRTKDEFPKWLARLHAEWEKKYPQTPAHWAHNGGGQRVQTLMKLWDLPWSKVCAQVEQYQILTKLSDTSLTEVEFVARLVILKETWARGESAEKVVTNVHVAT